MKAVEAKQFTVAGKSVFLSNNKKVAHSVSKALFDRGVRTPQGGRFPIVNQAEDLGIETAMALKRQAAVVNKRLARIAKRAGRVKTLTKLTLELPNYIRQE